MDQNNEIPPMLEKKPERDSSSSLVAVLLIAAVILIGVVYFWMNRAADVLVPEDQMIESIEEQSSSDAFSDIEADLNATDLENIDYDLSEENFTSS